MNRLVYGVGVNDADYVVQPRGESGKQSMCSFYGEWKGMMGRCYSPTRLERNPTYMGCAVVPEWHSFMAFKAWMASQDWNGKQLDKDLLQHGNKVYGPETCIFISGQLNLFTTDRGVNRGSYPIGVNWDARAKKFLARCRNPFTGKHEHLGHYTNQNDAHEAWRKRKHELACIYADQQIDPRIANALRTRYTETTK